MALHALMTEGFGPLVGSLAYTGTNGSGRDFQRQRFSVAGNVYPDSYAVRKRTIPTSWCLNSEGLMADAGSVENQDRLNQDISDAAGRLGPFDGVYPAGIPTHPRNLGFYILGTAFVPRYYLGPTAIGTIIGGAGTLPVLDNGTDYVSEGGGLIIVLRSNGRKVVNGAGTLVDVQTVWQMLNAFPRIGPSGAVEGSACDVAGIYTGGTGNLIFDRGTTNNANTWPPAATVSFSSSNHPIINGPYGNVAGTFQMRVGEWSRLIAFGQNATAIGFIDNQIARTNNGQDAGTSMAPIVACTKGRGRIVVIGCQDMICNPAYGGGFGGPLVPAAYTGRTLLMNCIAWVTQRTPIPPHPIYNP